MDFVPSLETDTSLKILMSLDDPSDLVRASCVSRAWLKILMSLDDPSDLVRASCVSRAWHEFVVCRGLCKQLCMRKFLQLSRVDHVKEASDLLKTDAETGCSRFCEWEKFRREHRIYAFLAHCCTIYPLRNCIFAAISASSTDNFPEESIDNTLEVRERVGRMASYWSSKGQEDPSVPETLTYKLLGDICVISEIGIQPFEAYFQPGQPIYSFSHVRFRVGYSVGPVAMADVDADVSGQMHHGCADEKFVWTYTSPEFPMAQENRLQTFKLQEPVLCVGGFILVELLGRVQRQEMDGLFYICVTHVQVIGQCLSTSFGVEALKPSGNFVLKVLSYAEQRLTEENPHTMPTDELQIHSRNSRHILNMLTGNDVDIGYALGESEDESDEEFV